MQEEIKRPMTLEELVGDIEREPFTLVDGKPHLMKNSDELTPNQRRELNETLRDINTPGKLDMEEEFAARTRFFDLIFVEPIDSDISDNTPDVQLRAALDFFLDRVIPEREIARLRRIVQELTEMLEAASNGDTSAAESSDSTE